MPLDAETIPQGIQVRTRPPTRCRHDGGLLFVAEEAGAGFGPRWTRPLSRYSREGNHVDNSGMKVMTIKATSADRMNGTMLRMSS